MKERTEVENVNEAAPSDDELDEMRGALKRAGRLNIALLWLGLVAVAVGLLSPLTYFVLPGIVSFAAAVALSFVLRRRVREFLRLRGLASREPAATSDVAPGARQPQESGRLEAG